MGRKVKRGLDYFPLYHDFFTSKKIKALRRAHGSIGILTYLAILCRVYDNGYYYKFDNIGELSMDIAEEIANEQLRKTATGVAETISYLVEQGILDEGLFKRDVISGVALQEQYVISSYKAKRKIRMDVYCLISKSEKDVDVGGSTPENNISSEQIDIYSEEMGINSEESTQRESKSKNKDSFTHSMVEDKNENTVVSEKEEAKQKFIGGSLGGGVVFLSGEQLDDLLERLSIDEFHKYVGKVRDSELKGHHYTRRTHYQAILEMAEKDRRIKGKVGVI